MTVRVNECALLYYLRFTAVSAIKIPENNRGLDWMPCGAHIVIYFRMVVKLADKYRQTVNNCLSCVF